MSKRAIAAVGVALGLGVLVVLAATYPSIKGFSERAKRSGSIKQLTEIAAAEESYFAKHGEYFSVDPYPIGSAGSTELDWDSSVEASHGFSVLGWKPAGPVYCRSGVSAKADAFTVEMECDPEDSRRPVYLGIVRPPKGQRDGIVGPFGKCPTKGVISSRSLERMLEQGPESYRFLPGACDKRSGRVLGISPMESNKP